MHSYIWYACDTHMLWSLEHGRGRGGVNAVSAFKSLWLNPEDISCSLKRLPMALSRDHVLLCLIIAFIFASGVIIVIFICINKCILRTGKQRIYQLHRRSSNFTVKSNKYEERSPSIKTPPLPPRTQFLTAEAQSYENLAEDYEQVDTDSEQDKAAYEQADPDYEQADPDYEQDKAAYEQADPAYEQADPDYEQDKAAYEQADHDYEQDKAAYEQADPDYVQADPDYVQADPDYVQDIPDYVQSIPDYVQSIPDYVQSIPDYVQSIPGYVQSIPDYVQSIPDYVQNIPEDNQNMDEQSDYVKVEDEEELLPLPPPPLYNGTDPAADNISTDDYDDIGGEDDEEDYDDVG